MLDVGDGCGEVGIVVEEMCDGGFDLMRLHEAITEDAVCEAIWGKRNRLLLSFQTLL
jgi:hypothetical protein